MQLSAITSPAPYSPAGSTGSQKPANNAGQAPEQNTKQNPEQQTTTGSRVAGSNELTEADHRQIAQLQKIDREVRAHEAAHIAASGGLARGGASFSYAQGPDGKRYAVSGEVSIDTSPVRGDPQATLLKAQRIQAAALAPAQPSSADRAIAASAASMAAIARAELLSERISPEGAETEGTDKQESDTVNGRSTINNNDGTNGEAVGSQTKDN